MKNEIESLIYEVEKKTNAKESDLEKLLSDANRHRETGFYNLDKCVGKVTITNACSNQTLKTLVHSNMTPHTTLNNQDW